MKKQGKIIILVLIAVVAVVSLIGSGITQTDKIKRKVWGQVSRGAVISTKGNWWNGDIKLVEENLNPDNEKYELNSKSDFVELIKEKKLYVVTFRGSDSNFKGFDKIVFADDQGNVIGFDNSFAAEIKKEPK
ncbi:MAG: hypothetical protein QMB63_07520 [Clostridiaceae bacterium]